jgi:hypothetical protein
MQQKERNFEHVDKNKKQEGFSNGFLQDIVISFILARRDTTYACCSQHQFSPCFVSFKFCLKDLLIGLQHLLSCLRGLSWFFWLLSCNLHIEDTIHVEITNTLKSKV